MPDLHDPYQNHLDRAESLFQSGDVMQAGQIWQAILKRRPEHAGARAGLFRVKERLERPDPAAVPQAAPPAPVPADQPSETQKQKAVRLVQEGAQLYEMGMNEDAMAKWEEALAAQPDHPDAAAYLAMARRERVAPPPTGRRAVQAQSPAGPPPVAPAPPVPEPGPAAQREARIERAERVLREGRLADAAQAFQQLLETGPQDPRVLQGYHHTRALLAARDAPPVALAVVPARVPSLMPKAPAVLEPAGPPRSLTVPSAAPRAGFRLPDLVKDIRVPAWFQSPRNLAVGLGALGLVVLGLSFYNLHRREVALRKAVAAAKLDALKPVSRMVKVPALVEPTEAVRREAGQALAEEPLVAYYRAQELLRRDPDDADAAKLAAQARDRMAAIAAPADPEAFDQDIKEGNLDAARTCILNLLRMNPDDPDLRGRAKRVLLALAPLYATEGHLGQARDTLRLGRAMFPRDPSWQARLRLLEALQAMPERDRAPWLQLLG